MAYRVAWYITKNPAIRVLYVSSTANLAIKQLKFIKDILTSKTYRRYWPEMINEDEAKREKWTESEISVDHPARSDEYIRDPTVFTAGLTTNVVGLHADVICLDDVVVADNAYTEDNRAKVRTQISYLASIASADSEFWGVGTRYHPLDVYNDLITQRIEMFDDDGQPLESEPLWEVWTAQVEDRGDGTGSYLWPRQQRGDGKWFGFDQRVLAVKRASYLDKTKFKAQYYNDPNDEESSPIKREMFQYYDPGLLKEYNGFWEYSERRLNVFASIDFAFSTSKESDYTAIAVVGCDKLHNYYILDLSHFKTDRIGDYFAEILRLHTKWHFRKLRAETNVAQKVIVRDIKDNYVRPNGLALSIDEHRPSSRDGAKEDRINANLQPKYQNLQMWHQRGGLWELLEEQLVQQNPAHDDLKDAVSTCMEICVAPTFARQRVSPQKLASSGYEAPTRFGGMSI